MTSNEWRR